MSKRLPHRPQRAPLVRRPTAHIIEAEVASGLEWIARDEIHRVLGKDARAEQIVDQSGAVRFAYSGDLGALGRLRTVQAVYMVRSFAVPRPKALLGDQHFRVLVDQIATVRALTPHSYHTLHIGAAGSDSPVMQRLKDELARATGLRAVTAAADHLRPRRRASPSPALIHP
jgi:hypothetical protein